MRRWQIATIALLVAIFAFEVYRAATQSITIDEARLYTDYLRPDPTVILHKYDAGHHILQTYLSWFFVHRFGWSEFILRLPSVLAAIAYLAFCYRFAKRIAAGSGVLLFATALLLAANPLILDALVMARGYGLALALFAWSLLLGIESLERRTLPLAGILAGLSAAANLTFLIPTIALLATVSVLQIRRNGGSLYHLIREYLGPALVVCALLVMLPLTEMRLDLFYTGASSIWDAIGGTTRLMFARQPWGASVIGYSAGLVAIAFLCFANRSNAFRITAFTLTLTLAATLLAHLRGVPYPTARTAIAILFLIEVTVLTTSIRRYAYVPLLLCGLFLLFQNDPRFFGEWKFDSRTKQVMRIIQQRQNGHPAPYRISAHNDYAWTLNYYRLRFHQTNLEEIKTGGPHPGADYYLLHTAASAETIQTLHLNVIYQDPLCACLLATAQAHQ